MGTETITTTDTISRILFSVRLVYLDTYNAPPLHKDYGILHPIDDTPSWGNVRTTSSTSTPTIPSHSGTPSTGTTIHHPVIRVFGSTPAGQTCCVHFHGIFPYFYIHLEDRHRILLNPQLFCKSLELALENELSVHNNNNNSTNKGFGNNTDVTPTVQSVLSDPSHPSSSSSSSSHASVSGIPSSTSTFKKSIRSINVVKGIPYYGYHYSGPDTDASISGIVRPNDYTSSSVLSRPYSRILPHEQGHIFAKIILYSPSQVRRTVDILESGRIFNTVYQPYEAHVPFLLQFLIDYNLCGMSLIHLKDLRFRLPLPLQLWRQQFINKLIMPQRSSSSSIASSASPHYPSTVSLMYDSVDKKEMVKKKKNEAERQMVKERSAEEEEEEDYATFPSSVPLDTVYSIPLSQRVWIQRTTPSILCHPYPVSSINTFTRTFLNDMMTTDNTVEREATKEEEKPVRTVPTATTASTVPTNTPLPLLPIPSWLHGDIYGIKRPQDIHGYAKNTTGIVSKETVCDIEVDAWVDDILNPLDRDRMRRNAAIAADRAALRRLQRKQQRRPQQNESSHISKISEDNDNNDDDDEKVESSVPFSSVFSLAYLWEEEKERRKALGLSQQSSPPPPLDTTVTTLSTLTPSTATPSHSLTTLDNTPGTVTRPPTKGNDESFLSVNTHSTGGGGGYASREQWMGNPHTSDSPEPIIDIDLSMERQLQRIVHADHQQEQKLRQHTEETEYTLSRSSTGLNKVSSQSYDDIWKQLPKAGTLDYGKETIRLIPTVDRLMHVRSSTLVSPKRKDGTVKATEEESNNLKKHQQESPVIHRATPEENDNVSSSTTSGGELLEWLVNQTIVPTNTTRSSSLVYSQELKSSFEGSVSKHDEAMDETTQPATPIDIHSLPTKRKPDSTSASSIASSVSSRRSSVSTSSSSSISSISSTAQGTTPLRNPLQNLSHEEGDNLFQRLSQRGRSIGSVRESPRRTRSLTISPEGRNPTPNVFSQTSNQRSSQIKANRKELYLPSPLSLVRLARITEQMTSSSTGKIAPTTVIKKRQSRTLELVPSHFSPNHSTSEEDIHDVNVDHKSVRRARREWDDIVLSQCDNTEPTKGKDSSVQNNAKNISLPTEFQTWLQVSQNNPETNVRDTNENKIPTVKFAPDNCNEIVPYPFSDEDEDEMKENDEVLRLSINPRGSVDIARNTVYLSGSRRRSIAWNQVEQSLGTDTRTGTLNDIPENIHQSPVTPTVARVRNFALESMGIHQSTPPPLGYTADEIDDMNGDILVSDGKVDDDDDRSITPEIDLSVVPNLEPMDIDATQPDVSEQINGSKLRSPLTPPHIGDVMPIANLTNERGLLLVRDDKELIEPPSRQTMKRITFLSLNNSGVGDNVIADNHRETETRQNVVLDLDYFELTQPDIVPSSPSLTEYSLLHGESLSSVHVYRMNFIPPTTEYLLSTFHLYGLPEVVHKEPHYSNDKDVPDKPKVFAGMLFRIPGNSIHHVPTFDTTGSIMRYYQRRKAEELLYRRSVHENSNEGISQRSHVSTSVSAFIAHEIHDIHRRNNLKGYEEPETFAITSTNGANLQNQIHRRDMDENDEQDDEEENDKFEDGDEDNIHNHSNRSIVPQVSSSTSALQLNVYSSNQPTDLSREDQLMIHEQLQEIALPYKPLQSLEYYASCARNGTPIRPMEKNNAIESNDLINDSSIIEIGSGSSSQSMDNVHAFIPETLLSDKIISNPSAVSSLLFGFHAPQKNNSLQLRRYILQQPAYNQLHRRDQDLCINMQHVVFIPRSLYTSASIQPRLKCVRLMVQWALPFPTYNHAEKWLKRHPIQGISLESDSKDSGNRTVMPKFDANTGSIIPEGQAIGCGNRGILTDGMNVQPDLLSTPQQAIVTSVTKQETPLGSNDTHNQSTHDPFMQVIGNENVSATLRNNNPSVGFRRKLVLPNHSANIIDNRGTKSSRTDLPTVPSIPLNITSSVSPSQLSVASSNITSSQTISSTDVNQHLSILSVEVHANSRGNLLPDPKQDSIQAIMYAIASDDIIIAKRYEKLQEKKDFEFPEALILGCIMVDPLVSFHFKPSSILEDDGSEQKIKAGLGLPPRVRLITVPDEITAIWTFVKLVRTWDIDMIIGYEIQMTSLGYMLDRARMLRIPLGSALSRTPYASPDRRLGTDDWGQLHDSGLWITGRIILNGWRLFRGEMKLGIYSFENVVWNTLHQRVPHFPSAILSTWWNGTNEVSASVTRNRVINYFISRAALTLHLTDHIDLIGRSSEMARLFGIDFFSVLSRGSQYRVEAVMIRVSKPLGFLAPSASRVQVARQAAMECIPLIMEPQSRVYSSPVIVLDFQSLYPSIIIAYNMCYSTCVGRLASSTDSMNPKLGFATYTPPTGIFARSYEGMGKATSVRKRINQVVREQQQQSDANPSVRSNNRPHRPDSLFFSPNGTVFVPWTIRQGVLPRMLREILDTRVMVKNAMKGKEVKADPVATRVMHARQFALKMIANVTYGYTAAGFSGRMPCAEIADAIVQTARSTLEGAIRIVEANDRWRARVVYGDTDSLFVSVPGRSVQEAFRIGEEIADTVTANNPRPITLKLEKVYHPCVLVAKKRYAGAMYESPTQETPTLDAKGLELVRRDQCGIVGTMMETSLRTLFATMNLSLLRDYSIQCWTQMFQGALSIADFIFAKEVRLGTYSARGPQPPAAVVASKAMLMDRRAEPRYGERVRYVVVLGAPESRLVDTVIPPLALLRNPGSYRLNVIYYITKAIIPSLDRILSLIGVDIKQWFTEMHRPTPRRIRALPIQGITDDSSAPITVSGSVVNRLFPNKFTKTTTTEPIIDLSSSPQELEPPNIEEITEISLPMVPEGPIENSSSSSSTTILTSTPLPPLSSTVQGKQWWIKHDLRVHQTATVAQSMNNPGRNGVPYPMIHRPRTIDAYYAHSHCEVCGETTRNTLCDNCTNNSQRSGYLLLQRQAYSEENRQRQMETCMACSRIADPSEYGAGACDSLDCPVLYDRFRFHDENIHLRSVLEEVGLL